LLANMVAGHLVLLGIMGLAFGATAATAFADAPTWLWGGTAAAFLGMVLWGVGMGAQESIMRAAVGGMVAPDKRGSAYGVFNAGFGLAWFTGSVIMGALYDVSIASLVAFSVIFQLAAIPVLYRLRTDAGV